MPRSFVRGRNGFAKMSIRPIIHPVILLVLLVILFGVTALAVIRNKFKTSDKIFTLFRFFLIYACAFIIGIRPVIVEENYEYSTKNLDGLFVVDTTISMWAEDYNGSHTRMECVKKDVDRIMKTLEGSNFALVTFDNSSHVLAPFTQDEKYVKDFFDTFVSPESYYAKGSDMEVPYKDIGSLLKSSNKKEGRKTIIFYIGDGEITNDKPLTDHSAFSELIDDGAVLGYGTEEGGKMRDGEETTYYIYDYSTHDDAVSKIDEDNLQKIADDMNVPYFNMYDKGESLQGKVEMIRQGSGDVMNSGKGVEKYRDIYFYFAYFMVFMLFLEMMIAVRRGRL